MPANSDSHDGAAGAPDASPDGPPSAQPPAEPPAGPPNGAPSHFFAFLSRMQYIRRWGLMFSTLPENISEHSLRVAMISHALVLIRNTLFGGTLNPDRAAALALYHDATEVLTGDLPAPVKYFNPDIEVAYKAIESKAADSLLAMLPEPLRPAFATYVKPDDSGLAPIVKAADKLCAYLKCLQEIGTGNLEFARAERTLRNAVDAIDLPEVHYFLQVFVPSFRLPLDDLAQDEPAAGDPN